MFIAKIIYIQMLQELSRDVKINMNLILTDRQKDRQKDKQTGGQSLI